MSRCTHTHTFFSLLEEGSCSVNLRSLVWRFFIRVFGLPPAGVFSSSESPVAVVPESPAGAPASPSRGRPAAASRSASAARVADEDCTSIKVLDVVAFNAEVEPQAVALWCSMLKERGSQRVGAMCVEAAFRFDVSTETAKRWLLKHSAESAEFVIQRGVVSLRE